MTGCRWIQVNRHRRESQTKQLSVGKLFEQVVLLEAVLGLQLAKHQRTLVQGCNQGLALGLVFGSANPQDRLASSQKNAESQPAGSAAFSFGVAGSIRQSHSLMEVAL